MKILKKIVVLQIFVFIFCLKISEVIAFQDLMCEQAFNHMFKEPSLNNMEKKINQWKKMKKKCFSPGVHEIYLADLYQANNEFQKSRELAEMVIKKYGDQFDVKEAEEILMMIDIKEGKRESIGKRARKILDKYPNWYVGYLYVGLDFLDKGDYLKAIEYCEKANKIQPSPYSYSWLALIYYTYFKDYEKTLEYYQKALDAGIMAIMMRESAVSAVDSAMKLNKWDFAQSILNAQAKIDKTIENYPQYRELRARMDAYEKEHSITDNEISIGNKTYKFRK